MSTVFNINTQDQLSSLMSETFILPFDVPSILACGPETKNTFCLANERKSILSNDMGDLTDWTSYNNYVECIDKAIANTGINPEIVACDLHPDYVSTRHGVKMKCAHMESVQHHHAHAAACMLENALSGPTIAVTFDGMGYGDDGTLWGGEFLVCDLTGYSRFGHLKSYSLPGGDQATLHPERMAYSCLSAEFGENSGIVEAVLPGLNCEQKRVLDCMIQNGINSPLTSSVGRLFDAIAAILGFRGRIAFPAQAAVELQKCAAKGVDGIYDYIFSGGIVDFGGVIRAIAEEIVSGCDKGVVSAKFHNTLADMVVNVCKQARADIGINDVVLSGGVFFNGLLKGLIMDGLINDGFMVYNHKRLSTGDGNVSLGQAVVAGARNQIIN